MQKAGFIGLGSMGSHMAKNILKAGYSLTVFDINHEAMDELERLGAHKANSPKEVGENSQIVFLMVQNFSQCESCILGTDGLLEGIRKGVIIVSSTISPDEVLKIEEFCKEQGIEVLDCPVSGGTKGAKDGMLTLMAAGKDEVYKECLPILQTVGSNIVHVGNKVGLGQSIKAVNQHLASINYVALVETMVLGIKSGLDPELIYHVVKVSTGNSWVFENIVPSMLSRDFSEFNSRNILKDLNICQDMGNRTKSPLFLGNVCKEMFKLADSKNLGSDDFSSIVKIYEEMGDILVGKDGSDSKPNCTGCK